MTERTIRLLLFNLMTDADDSNLGFTTDWINALAARCNAIDVVTMQVGRLAVAENVRVYSVGKERGWGEARRALVFYRILFRLLRANRYDACFAHMMPLFVEMGAPLLKVWRVPVVLWYAHKSVSLQLRLAEKIAWRVVTASPESFRLPSRKSRVIGHGVDTQLFAPPPAPRPADQPFQVVSVGRIAPVKHLETVIEALTLIDPAHGLQLRLVGQAAPGDEAYAARLREGVRARGLGARVEFAGAVNHDRVAAMYQSADVMVNTSRTGSIDKAVLEAMACGLPVVTSNEAFAPMLAPWGDLLCVPPESPVALAASLERLQAMPPDDRAALGRALREIVVRDHSLERLVGQLIAIFRTGEADADHSLERV